MKAAPPAVRPGRLEAGSTAFTSALFLEGAIAFTNTVSSLLLAFDLGAIERAANARPTGHLTGS